MLFGVTLAWGWTIEAGAGTYGEAGVPVPGQGVTALVRGSRGPWVVEALVGFDLTPGALDDHEEAVAWMLPQAGSYQGLVRRDEPWSLRVGGGWRPRVLDGGDWSVGPALTGGIEVYQSQAWRYLAGIDTLLAEREGEAETRFGPWLGAGFAGSWRRVGLEARVVDRPRRNYSVDGEELSPTASDCWLAEEPETCGPAWAQEFRLDLHLVARVGGRR